MRRMMIPVAATAMLIALCGGASAQVNPFKGKGPTLNKDDLTQLDAAIDRLNSKADVAPGAKEDWSNPKTGAGGTVSVLRVFQSGGHPCHVLRTGVASRPNMAIRNYDLTWCQVADGSWKVR